MKKYLMTVMAAVALGGLFTGCSNDVDLSGGNTAEFNIVKNYEDAFITRFGQPHENQTWGFGESVTGTRSGNTSGDYTAYPATHEYTDANGKVIAGANMNHNQWGSTDLQSMPYGGWIVPDPLTEGQKFRVQKYFQANPNLSYKDPHYANFYVQQVYTGGTDAPETGNKEVTVSANGNGHKGMTLNQLTVGQAGSHINDFNAGTCSPSNVLNHEGKTQSDQITLMVNVDDTSCFGYHETDGSNVQTSTNHNDKMALVSAAVIDEWAEANGIGGDPVVDKWNRSFMGFDYELLPESQVIVPNTYAMLSNFPGNLPTYVWDGENVMKIGTDDGSVQGGRKDFINNFTPPSWYYQPSWEVKDGKVNWNANQWGQMSASFSPAENLSTYDKMVLNFERNTAMTVKVSINGKLSDGSTRDVIQLEIQLNANHGKKELDLSSVKNDLVEVNSITIQAYDAGTFTLSEAYFETGGEQMKYYESSYILAGTNQIPFYSENTNMYGGEVRTVSEDEMRITKDGMVCVNLKLFKDLYDQGFRPTSSKLQDWVKWQPACDGYYSDWIVTLTEAQRITPSEDPPYNPPTEPDGIVCRIIVEDLTVGESSDFDFNDVVFDVCKNGDLIVRAIGGELPIYIGAENAHEVHAECSVTLSDTDKGRKSHLFMRNTGWTWSGDKASATIDYKAKLGTIKLGGTFNTPADAQKIGIWVHKNGKNYKLEAPKGKVASMVCVGTDYEWCRERQDIDDKYHKGGVRLFREYVIGNQDYQGKWQDKNAWYHKMNQ